MPTPVSTTRTTARRATAFASTVTLALPPGRELRGVLEQVGDHLLQRTGSSASELTTRAGSLTSEDVRLGGGYGISRGRGELGELERDRRSVDGGRDPDRVVDLLVGEPALDHDRLV